MGMLFRSDIIDARLLAPGCLILSAIMLAVGCGSGASSGEYPTPPDCTNVGPTDGREFTAILRPKDTTCTEKLEQAVQGVMPTDLALRCSDTSFSSGYWIEPNDSPRCFVTVTADVLVTEDAGPVDQGDSKMAIRCGEKEDGTFEMSCGGDAVVEYRDNRD